MTSPIQEHKESTLVSKATLTNTNNDDDEASHHLTDGDNKQKAFLADIINKEEALPILGDDTDKENEESNPIDTKQQEALCASSNDNWKHEATPVPIETNDHQQQQPTNFTDTEWWEDAIPNNTDNKQEANPNNHDKSNPIDAHREKEANPNNDDKCCNIHDNKQKQEDDAEKDQGDGVPHREEAVVFSDNQGVVSVPTTDDQTEETISNQQEATSSRRFELVPSTQYHIVQFEENYITVTVTNNNEAVDQWIDSIKHTHNDRLQELLIGLYIELIPTEETEAPWRDLVTLQLCVGKECLVFLLQQAGKTMSIKLRHFLYTGGYTFVSPWIDAQDKKLQEFNLYVAKRVDLRELAAYRRQDLVIYQRDGVEELTRAILRKEYKRPPEVKFYPWQVVLSEEQVKYACLDAYLCYEIGKALDAYGFRVQTRFYLSHIFTYMGTRSSSFGGSSR